jgi:hypothetical protein
VRGRRRLVWMGDGRTGGRAAVVGGTWQAAARTLEAAGRVALETVGCED